MHACRGACVHMSGMASHNAQIVVRIGQPDLALSTGRKMLALLNTTCDWCRTSVTLRQSQQVVRWSDGT